MTKKGVGGKEPKKSGANNTVIGKASSTANTDAADIESTESYAERFFEKMGVDKKKTGELLRNRRVSSTAAVLYKHIPGVEALSEEKKKLMRRVAETAADADSTLLYAQLITNEHIKNEADMRNAQSIVERQENKDAKIEEICTIMKRNIPEKEEMALLAEAVVEKNKGAPRVRLLKELKHHPRMAFVSSKIVLDLLDSFSISLSGKEVNKGEPTDTSAKQRQSGLTPGLIEELLQMGMQEMPATREINRVYREAVVQSSLLKSTEKKHIRYLEGEMQTMHTPFTNYQKTPGILRKHIERTGGKVRVRFPPEPNGHLHIGHAKAMSINFGFRDFYNGWIALRYDDTNPKAEKKKYYEKIREMVEWMGYIPDAVTYASDYFPQLYLCAIELIKRGKAYVCHLAKESVAEERKEVMAQKLSAVGAERAPSPWRNRTVEENLYEFERMKNGHYQEGQAVLRMKMDMASNNPQLWDLVAYRIIKHFHPRTGTKWIIYPSYDFTHCLTDSFEDITHSFCTTEFINARESYNWLCDALDLYRPVQWEYSRLCITGALLSKRFILGAIKEGRFSGWEDPRLATLAGLRARGVPPSSIRRFVESLGITTAGSEVPMHQLENIIREDLAHSPCTAVVLRPVEILDPEGAPILIDQKDIREREKEPDPSFFRLQRGGHAVMLKKIGKVELDAPKGCTRLKKSDKKHLATIPWLATDDPTAVIEIIDGVNIKKYEQARISLEAMSAAPGSCWQFLRAGYFIRVDTPELHFRLVVPLKAAPLLE